VLAARLRALSTPIVGRMADDALLLDLRCLADEAAFLRVLAEMGAADVVAT
jgi:L-seryl-tRNA(Ser) seleniumtransferase